MAEAVATAEAVQTKGRSSEDALRRKNSFADLVLQHEAAKLTQKMCEEQAKSFMQDKANAGIHLDGDPDCDIRIRASAICGGNSRQTVYKVAHVHAAHQTAKQS